MSLSSPSNSLAVVAYLQSFSAVLFVDHAAIVILVRLTSDDPDVALLTSTLPIQIYDYLLTLDEEIRFVWTKTPWNLAKILFLGVRYAVFIPTILVLYVNTSRSFPLASCSVWTNAEVYGTIGVVVMAELVLGLRAWAFWGRNRIVAACIITTVIMLLAGESYKIANIDESHSTFGIDVYNVSGYCPPSFSDREGSSGSSAISTGFTLIVVYETLILVLTLIQAYRQGCFESGGSKSRFLHNFVSQGP
ncbi:hypothetical protein V5O48_008002 [Marasmius crinis-equi]|uniref:DUF6533 domain-containing protein n=1 Tax=Marasmius crinis-equi TaxID=585013 RepID=A0ABR3FFA4_9AGAR